MNRYFLTYFTDSHEELFRKYLEPTFNEFLSRDYELIYKISKQISKTGNFMEEGWKETTKQKIVFIYDFIKDKDSGIVIFSDPDVIIKKNIVSYIDSYLSRYDIVFQHDKNTICTGFFSFRITPKIKDFFKKVLDEYDYELRDDQINVDEKIRTSDLKWREFPKEIFNICRITEGRWLGGEIPFPNYEIYLFHANWTIGLDNKRKLLDAYRSL